MLLKFPYSQEQRELLADWLAGIDFGDLITEEDLKNAPQLDFDTERGLLQLSDERLASLFISFAADPLERDGYMESARDARNKKLATILKEVASLTKDFTTKKKIKFGKKSFTPVDIIHASGAYIEGKKLVWRATGGALHGDVAPWKEGEALYCQDLDA